MRDLSRVYAAQTVYIRIGLDTYFFDGTLESIAANKLLIPEAKHLGEKPIYTVKTILDRAENPRRAKVKKNIETILKETTVVKENKKSTITFTAHAHRDLVYIDHKLSSIHDKKQDFPTWNDCIKSYNQIKEFLPDTLLNIKQLRYIFGYEKDIYFNTTKNYIKKYVTLPENFMEVQVTVEKTKEIVSSNTTNDIERKRTSLIRLHCNEQEIKKLLPKKTNSHARI